jgi:hypothetical protein
MTNLAPTDVQEPDSSNGGRAGISLKDNLDGADDPEPEGSRSLRK